RRSLRRPLRRRPASLRDDHVRRVRGGLAAPRLRRGRPERPGGDFLEGSLRILKRPIPSPTPRGEVAIPRGRRGGRGGGKRRPREGAPARGREVGRRAGRRAGGRAGGGAAGPPTR